MPSAVDSWLGDDAPADLLPVSGASEGSAEPEASGAGVVAPQAEPGEPQFTTHTTPNGIEVLYQWAPKRLYRVRKGEDDEWVEVPSVTTVLGILDKPGLPWWGMKVGVEGVLELAERGLVTGARYDDGVVRMSVPIGSVMVPATVENVVPLLTEKQLTVNHVRDQAGDRGTSVHNAFEDWSVNGTLPAPEIYPESEQGYVRALLKFLEEAPLEPVAAEVTVGSIEHRFAGRYDLRAAMSETRSLVTAAAIEGKRKGEKREEVKAGTVLLDLKTSAGFYDSQFMQLEGYELASIECGFDPTDYRMVVRLDASGQYEVEVSKATGDDFLAIVAAQAQLEDLKRRRSKRRRAS